MQLTLAADAPTSLTLHADVRLTRSGRAMRLVDSDGAHQAAAPHASLVRLLAQAHCYWRELRKGELNVSELASAEAISAAYLTRVLRLAFLSPPVTDAILAGRQRGGIDAIAITGPGAIEASWSAQAAAWLKPAQASGYAATHASGKAIATMSRVVAEENGPGGSVAHAETSCKVTLWSRCRPPTSVRSPRS